MKTAKTILIHTAVLTALSALVVFGCPFFRLTGFTCPGCGLTRAYIHAFHGDFATAFRYNPFFFTLPFYVFVFSIEIALLCADFAVPPTYFSRYIRLFS